MPERKTRILQIITRLIIGGAQETVMLIADMLDRQRYQMDVVSGPQTGPEGSLIEEVRQRGIRLMIVPELVREVNWYKDLVAFIRLYRLIKREGYDLVHTNSSKAGIVGRWAAWLAGVPVILHTVHGWGHHDYQHVLVRKAFILLERATAAITDRLVVVSSRNIEKGLADRIGHSHKYVTIRSGIELERFSKPRHDRASMRAQIGIPTTAPVVGTVTRLSPQKAPLDFVAAAISVARALAEAHFVIVGDGPLRSEVEQKIATAGLQDRFHLLGLRRDVADILAAFDVFALSSLWEGLPRVLPQAMAASLPIVATAIDGNAEIVIDGENGILVPPHDCEKLSRAILALLRDSQTAARMGSNGRRRVYEFSAEKMVSDYDQLCQSLLREIEGKRSGKDGRPTKMKPVRRSKPRRGSRTMATRLIQPFD